MESDLRGRRDMVPFSVSASNLATVTQYIQNQENHHRKITFEDEFIALLRKHGIDFDPKYVFG